MRLTLASISLTIERKSRPLAFAETTIIRETFSRLIVLGPVPSPILATVPKGIFCPSGVSINKLRIVSIF